MEAHHQSPHPESGHAEPTSAWQAIGRGMRGKCPRCESARLFGAFLKPIDRCPVCKQDWTLQRADDFPAYVAIFVTGHVMAPIIIALVQSGNLPFWALTAIVLMLATFLMIGTLQPAKGAIIAVQWWFRMHGFERNAPDLLPAEQGDEIRERES